MAIIDIKVPDIGDFAEVAIIEVLVQPGDTIKAEQSLVTVESDKASMEIPSSHAGVVKELKVKLGDKIAEGAVVLTLEVASAPAAAPSAASPTRATRNALKALRWSLSAAASCSEVLAIRRVCLVDGLCHFPLAEPGKDDRRDDQDVDEAREHAADDRRRQRPHDFDAGNLVDEKVLETGRGCVLKSTQACQQRER